MNIVIATLYLPGFCVRDASSAEVTVICEIASNDATQAAAAHTVEPMLGTDILSPFFGLLFNHNNCNNSKDIHSADTNIITHNTVAFYPRFAIIYIGLTKLKHTASVK